MAEGKATNPAVLAAAAADRRDTINRWLLSTPALIILLFAAIGPLAIVVVYSFLTKGGYGGVEWKFSTDAWYSVVGGLLPRTALALTKAAMAGDRNEARRLDGLLEPLWKMFKEFGSIRVVYTLVEHVLSAQSELPRPLLPLAPTERQRVLDVTEPLTALEHQSLL